MATVTNHQLLHVLLRASARVERKLDRSLSNIKGISFSEYQLLAALHGDFDGAATRVDLAEAVGLTPSGVTRALKPLEKLGFVETRKDARDARRSLAGLTPHGVELTVDAAGVVDDVLGSDDALAALSSAERRTLVGLLTTIS